MDFLHLAKERYSCRKLSDQPVEQEKIRQILEAAQAAPTAHNKQPEKIWVISNPENIRKIHEATPCTFGAGLFLVVGADPAQGWVREFDGRNFADIDAAIIGTHIMLAAEDLGLHSTWVGAFDPNVMKKNFPDMDGFDLIAIFPIGYALPEAHPSRLHGDRKKIEDIVEFL
jgi:nitroreductase